MSAMQKLDIATRIQQEAGISREAAATLLNWILEFFKTTLQQGESLHVPNFGVFTVRSKAARRGRNPRTGEEIIIQPRRVVTFRASATLKHEVNGGSAELHT